MANQLDKAHQELYNSLVENEASDRVTFEDFSALPDIEDVHDFLTRQNIGGDEKAVLEEMWNAPRLAQQQKTQAQINYLGSIEKLFEMMQEKLIARMEEKIIAMLKERNKEREVHGSCISKKDVSGLMTGECPLELAVSRQVFDPPLLKVCMDLLKNYSRESIAFKKSNLVDEVTYVQERSFILMKALCSKILGTRLCKKLEFFRQGQDTSSRTHYVTEMVDEDGTLVKVTGECDGVIYYLDKCIFVWEDKNLNETLEEPSNKNQIMVEVKAFSEKLAMFLSDYPPLFCGIITSGLVWRLCRQMSEARIIVTQPVSLENLDDTVLSNVAKGVIWALGSCKIRMEAMDSRVLHLMSKRSLNGDDDNDEEEEDEDEEEDDDDDDNVNGNDVSGNIKRAVTTISTRKASSNSNNHSGSTKEKNSEHIPPRCKALTAENLLINEYRVQHGYVRFKPRNAFFI